MRVLRLTVVILGLIIMIYHQLLQKSLCNIRRSRLILYSEEIIVDCQSGLYPVLNLLIYWVRIKMSQIKEINFV
jgi:hypothetical protein